MRALLKAILGLVLVFGIIVAALRATCIEFWTVPADDAHLSASILPSLEAGDLVVLRTRGQPGFAALVRCPHPSEAGRHVVGRVLGEAGDRIDIDGFSVKVNDKSLRTVRGCVRRQWKATDPESGEAVDLTCAEEEAGGITYARAHTQEAKRFAFTPVEVPEEHVFLVSDNRALPQDSRDYGPVSRSECLPIVFRLWGTSGWTDAEHRLTIVH